MAAAASSSSSAGRRRNSALNMPDVPSGQLPEYLMKQKTHVVCKADAPIHTDPIDYCGSYASMGVDNSAWVNGFSKDFKIIVNQMDEEEMVFEMIGIDAAIANAFRRILIAEIPTMAIEKVLVANNTSTIADEQLAHRLGLLPLDADPTLFEYLSENDASNERNTIVFKLDVSCKKGSPRLTVKTDKMTWLPGGSELPMATLDPSSKPRTYTSFSQSQDTMPEFSGKRLGMKHQDITIARLGPGQIIELEAHAVKGIGKVHAKWSPVATAWYRMFPEVELLKEVKGNDAEKLVKACPVNVFDIEDIQYGTKRATVVNPKACTLCRECLRVAGEDQVELRRVKNHFIFTIQSVGSLHPEVLFNSAVKILSEKCDNIFSQLC